MLLLTLLALEGMGRLAYYAAYGQGYGGGVADGSDNLTPPPPHPIIDATRHYEIRHPFYGYAHASPEHAINAPRPRQRQEDLVIIGLLGGSVARNVKPFLQHALNRWFTANRLPRQPVVLNLAIGGAKQPQQTVIMVNTLLLGGEFDLLVNLDGFNEINSSASRNPRNDIFPSFPDRWSRQVRLNGAEILRAGRIGILRREQARRAAIRETSPLRWSALFGLLNRYGQERTAAAIIQRNQQLATAAANYNLEKHGPRSWLATESELRPAAARVWYRGSLTLARLAELAGAEYYHFLQPNQYVPDSKPLSPEERAGAFAPDSLTRTVIGEGYPLLRAFNPDLQNQGIHYFDLTGIFADHPETLYGDICCHLNDRGNELLAAAMVERMAPALARRGGENRDETISPLAAARRPAQPVSAWAAPWLPAAAAGPAAAPSFQVSVTAEGKELRYVREGCAPEDTEPPFFLHLIPQDLSDLPPGSQAYGFDNRDFSFRAAGGRFGPGQCRAQIRLPDYPIKEIQTGQYAPDQGDVWSVKLIAAPEYDQLRVDYAALSTAEPAARDYFDLYVLDSRLLYFRETCTDQDTAAGFFLHILPEDVTDLPAARRAAGFVHRGFAFDRWGGHFDGKCLAAITLPDYPIKEIRTGQHIPGQGDLWSVELIAAPDPEQLRADYAALAAVEPAEWDYFDLYWRDNRLLYLRESCAAADTAAGFFLHIVPENPTDLPEDRREAGFAHGGFAFVRRGGHFDGKCLAAVPLPDYPIKQMRTGQFVPGQGDLWSVELMAAP